MIWRATGTAYFSDLVSNVAVIALQGGGHLGDGEGVCAQQKFLQFAHLLVRPPTVDSCGVSRSSTVRSHRLLLE